MIAKDNLFQNVSRFKLLVRGESQVPPDAGGMVASNVGKTTTVRSERLADRF